MILNALTFIYMTRGIPIVYYGTEALMDGGRDPDNRAPFDPLDYSGDRTVIKYLKVLNDVRGKHFTYDYEPLFKTVDNTMMIITKGPEIMVAVTNSDNVYEVRFVINHQF